MLFGVYLILGLFVLWVLKEMWTSKKARSEIGVWPLFLVGAYLGGIYAFWTDSNVVGLNIVQTVNGYECDCGNKITFRTAYCGQCGKENVRYSMAYCKHCHWQYEQDDKYCQKCGAKRDVPVR